MKKLLFLSLVFFVLTGMGGFGGEDETKLPKTLENYSISLLDTEGYTAKLSQASISDGLYLSGSIGKGKHIINFSEIKKIVITPINDKEVQAKVLFKDGTEVNLLTNAKYKLKGKSKYGVFTIALKDVSEITFLGKE